MGSPPQNANKGSRSYFRFKTHAQEDKTPNISFVLFSSGIRNYTLHLRHSNYMHYI